MASRQLRKLRKQQELLDLEKEAAQEESSDDEPVVAKPRANLFAGFAALGDEGDDDNDTEEEEAEPKDPQPAPVMEQLDGSTPAKKSKKSKKKKKKGKKPELAQPVEEEHESLDEIDKVLAELNVANPKKPGSSYTSQNPESQIAELLHINFQHLKAMNEMRKMFGSTGHDAEMESQPAAPRTRGAHQQVNLETFLSAPPDPRQGKAKGMFETVLRTNPFIEGKKNWPRDSAHGLKMEHLRTDDQGFGYFTFIHDKIYEELESSFFGLVQMYDPMQLVHFLHRYPYHVSSLIQVSKVAKQQDQNNALAADLIERALFTFGRASLSDFRKKLEQGKARLDFYRPENRQLFLAGHNLIKYLGDKGTIRTALEWTKLLLSLDPRDPYGLINWIHPLAIRAHEAQWLIDLCTKTKLLSSPLFINSGVGLYVKQTLVLAHLQLKDPAAARFTLLEGLHSAPWLYCSLFSALNIDAPKSVWGVRPRTDDEALHTELYLHMTKDLWDSPNVLNFLTSVASSAPRNQTYTKLPASPTVSLATARFIYLDNTPSLMSHVPSTLIHNANPNFDFDPLPPPRSENIFSSPVQEMPWSMSDDNGEASTGRGAMLRRTAGARLLAAVRAGNDIPDEHLEEFARVIRDEAIMAQVREELDGVRRAMREREREIERERERERVVREGMRRPFQASVADGEGEEEEIVQTEDREAVTPTEAAPAPTPGNDDFNGVMGMFRRVASILNRGGTGTPTPARAVWQGGDGGAILDTQGLPEPVYRALEDLELPGLPGAWGFNGARPPWDLSDGDRDGEIDEEGDYSAITGRGRDDSGGE